jgi:hypothetical protein
VVIRPPQKSSNISQMSQNLKLRLNSAYQNPEKYIPRKSNLLLDVLNVISAPGYAANNLVKGALKGKARLSDYIEGFTGQQKTEGSELFETIGVKSPAISSVAGFLWDVFNPLDPLNYLQFGIADDALKGSLKGVDALTRGFGKYGDEIVNVLTDAGKTVDDIADIGAPTVGKLAKRVMGMAGDKVPDVKTLMEEGLKLTGNVATTKLPYNSLKSITVGFGKHPFFSTPKTFHKIPGSKYLTAPITLAFQGIGKSKIGQVLGKAFNTKFVPNTVPDSVIVKALNSLDNGLSVDDVVTGVIDDVTATSKLNIIPGSEAYEKVRSGLHDMMSKIDTGRKAVIDEVNIVFNKVQPQEAELITDLLASGKVTYDEVGKRITDLDLDNIMSKQAQTAMDSFANTLRQIPKKYADLGVIIETGKNYVPRIARRPLTGDENRLLQDMFGVSGEANVADDFTTLFDPNLKGRKIGEATPKEINEFLATQGSKKPWLEENAAQLMAYRGIRAEQGIQAQTFLNQVTDTFGLTPDEFSALTKAFPDTPGYKMYKISSDGGKPILTEIHHRTGAEKMIEAGEKLQLLPEELAHMFNEYSDVLFGANKKNAVLKLFDAATSWYKKLAYLWNPGHLGRDLLGNVWNGYLMGVRNPKYYKHSAELLIAGHKIEQLNAIKATIEGLKDTGQDIPEYIIKSSKDLIDEVGENFTGDLIPVIDNLINKIDYPLTIQGKKIKASKIYQYAKGQEVLEVGYVAADTPSTILESLNVPKKNFFTRVENAYSGVMRKGTERLDEFTRMAGFLQQLETGKSLKDAAKFVRKYYFDYRDLTQFEKTVMKRVIPFYTWMRKNIPLQISELLQNPKKFRPIQSAADALNQEGVEEWQNKPQYIKELAAMMLGGTGYMFSPGLPYQDLARLGSLEQTAQDLLSSVNPIFRVPIELALNTKAFTGGPIEEYPGQTSEIPLSGILKFLGVSEQDIPRLNNRGVAYILNQVPLINNISTMVDPTSARSASRFSTFIGGPSLYNVEQAERSYEYEQYKALENLIRKLQDEGVYIPTLDEINGGR